MEEDGSTDGGGAEKLPVNRRRRLRSVFTYPVEFELLNQKAEGRDWVGYLRDLSLGGAGLEVEDPYGRFDTGRAENALVRLTISIPRENRVHISAHVRWVKRLKGANRVRMGIAFRDLDFEASRVIEKLVGLKGKDYTMMWNLWEQFYQ